MGDANGKFFMKSLKTQSTIDPDLFPLLTVRSCISEAEESLNGPRFCGQDKFTGSVYEIRSCLLVQPVQNSMSEEDRVTLRRQQDRIDVLMSASMSKSAPACVVFPADVYIQEQASTGAIYVVSVDAFGGLSLGDIIRSGWGMVEESVFHDVLQAVEMYGYASTRLPLHGNLSPDAIRPLLTVRDGAAEAKQRSRWVVGDWLLRHDPSIEQCDTESILGDIEWLLHSSFSQLNVSAMADGTFLSRYQIEAAINEVVSRVREALLASDGNGGVGNHSSSHAATGENPSASLIMERKLSAGDGASGSAAGVSSTEGNESETMTPQHPKSKVKPSAGHEAAGAESSSESGADGGAGGDVNDVFSHIRRMSLQERGTYHQNALRTEQALVNRYRRRNATLPPRPQGTGGPRRNSDYAREDDDYELQYLTSPLKPRTCQLLSHSRRGSASLTNSSGNGTPTGAKAARQLQERRNRLLESVVDLAVRCQEQRARAARQQEEDLQMQSEALRAVLLRKAAMAERRTGGTSRNNRGASVPVKHAAAAAPRGGHRQPPQSALHQQTCQPQRSATAHPRHSSAMVGRMHHYYQQVKKQAQPPPPLELRKTAGSPEPRRPSTSEHAGRRLPQTEAGLRSRTTPVPKELRVDSPGGETGGSGSRGLGVSLMISTSATTPGDSLPSGSPVSKSAATTAGKSSDPPVTQPCRAGGHQHGSVGTLATQRIHRGAGATAVEGSGHTAWKPQRNQHGPAASTDAVTTQINSVAPLVKPIPIATALAGRRLSADGEGRPTPRTDRQDTASNSSPRVIRVSPHRAGGTWTAQQAQAREARAVAVAVATNAEKETATPRATEQKLVTPSPRWSSPTGVRPSGALSGRKASGADAAPRVTPRGANTTARPRREAPATARGRPLTPVNLTKARTRSADGRFGGGFQGARGSADSGSHSSTRPQGRGNGGRSGAAVTRGAVHPVHEASAAISSRFKYSTSNALGQRKVVR